MRRQLVEWWQHAREHANKAQRALEAADSCNHGRQEGRQAGRQRRQAGRGVCSVSSVRGRAPSAPTLAMVASTSMSPRPGPGARKCVLITSATPQRADAVTTTAEPITSTSVPA